MRATALRPAALVFALALVAHGADHVRRDIDVPSRLSVVGGLQFVLGMAAVVLVLRAHRSAPAAAVAVGFGSAAIFIYGHLVPFGTDPYVGSHAADDVTLYSWFTALFEIGADLSFGLAGYLAMRRGVPTAQAAPTH
jgi:heme A synthase